MNVSRCGIAMAFNQFNGNISRAIQLIIDVVGHKMTLCLLRDDKYISTLKTIATYGYLLK